MELDTNYRRFDKGSQTEEFDLTSSMTLSLNKKMGWATFTSMQGLRDEEALNFVEEEIQRLARDVKFLRDWHRAYENPYAEYLTNDE